MKNIKRLSRLEAHLDSVLFGKDDEPTNPLVTAAKVGTVGGLGYGAYQGTKKLKKIADARYGIGPLTQTGEGAAASMEQIGSGLFKDGGELVQKARQLIGKKIIGGAEQAVVSALGSRQRLRTFSEPVSLRESLANRLTQLAVLDLGSKPTPPCAPMPCSSVQKRYFPSIYVDNADDSLDDFPDEGRAIIKYKITRRSTEINDGKKRKGATIEVHLISDKLKELNSALDGIIEFGESDEGWSGGYRHVVDHNGVISTQKQPGVKAHLKRHWRKYVAGGLVAGSVGANLLTDAARKEIAHAEAEAATTRHGDFMSGARGISSQLAHENAIKGLQHKRSVAGLVGNGKIIEASSVLERVTELSARLNEFVSKDSGSLLVNLPDDWRETGRSQWKKGKDGRKGFSYTPVKEREVGDKALDAKTKYGPNGLETDFRHGHSPSRLRRAKALALAGATGVAGYLVGKHGGNMKRVKEVVRHIPINPLGNGNSVRVPV